MLDASGLRYRICYAHKANQARAFVRAALAAGIGIDVASPGELAQRARPRASRPAGSRRPARRGATSWAPLAGTGVTVNVDNLWELASLIRLARAARHRGCRSWSGCAGSAPRARPSR